MASARGRPVVLTVEDESLLRINGAEIVADAGYDVVEAGNADEAIAILEARADIHIVFTDIQMPGSMDGLKLARFVRDRWPPIKLVATPGRVTIGEGDLPGRRIVHPQALYRRKDRGGSQAPGRASLTPSILTVRRRFTSAFASCRAMNRLPLTSFRLRMVSRKLSRSWTQGVSFCSSQLNSCS